MYNICKSFLKGTPKNTENTMTKIFIDGSAGTTGLRIYERIGHRADLELIRLPEELRKDPNARREALFAADIAFLCLPDAAAIEAVALAEGSSVKIIDTSTAHRCAPGWVYGFPEIGGRCEMIANASRIANPGCHASGFIALVAPLVSAGMLDAETVLSCFSLTGYSGGGKSMIADYEDPARDHLLDAPRQYGLSQKHKHLPEMAAVTGMKNDPLFCPIVGDFYAGMEVTVPLAKSQLRGTADDIRALYREVYASGLVRYSENADEGAFLSAAKFAGRDDMEVRVEGNDERILLVARYDNLGKGASGAAIQNMNILLGCDEAEGLVVG